MALSRTPRELLSSVTSTDITEMMAFERLEPFGGLAHDFRAGQIAAVIANTHRDPDRHPDAFTADDFMPSLRDARERAAPPVLLTDVDAQSALLDRVLFGGVAR